MTHRINLNRLNKTSLPVLGFTSWKTKGTGTWFVDALHKCVIEYEEDDIEMMRVRFEVI